MLQTLTSNMLGFHFLMRWLHLFFGVMWIGLLYYFNYVHGAFMAETTDAGNKTHSYQPVLRFNTCEFPVAAFVVGLEELPKAFFD